MKKLDWSIIEPLAERQWSHQEIASMFKVSKSTIQRRFGSKIDEARHTGKAKLRDVLWVRGVTEKDTRALIHLCDRVLGPIPKVIVDQTPNRPLADVVKETKEILSAIEAQTSLSNSEKS